MIKLPAMGDGGDKLRLSMRLERRKSEKFVSKLEREVKYSLKPKIQL